MLIRKLVLAITAFGTTALALAQTPVVPAPQTAPVNPATAPGAASSTPGTATPVGLTQARKDGEWRGGIGAAFSTSSGNTKSTSFILMGDAVRATEQDKVTLYGFSQYARSKAPTDQTSANLWRAGGKYDYNLTPKVFAFGGLDFEHDKLKHLSLRSAIAGGLGYHLINTADTTWDLFGGVGYKRDKFEDPGVNINGGLKTSYNSSELVVGEESNHRLTDSVSFRQRIVAYPNMKDRGEYRAVVDAGLVVALSNRVNLQMTLANRYDSMAESPIKKNDTTFFTGVGIALGAR